MHPSFCFVFCLVCLQGATGEERPDAIISQGKAAASAYEKHTKPFSDVKQGIKAKQGSVKCTFGYINSEPRTLNKHIGDRNASRAVASICHDCLLDGTFWDHADDIVSACFEDADEENAKKLIKLEHEKNME